LKLVVFGATGRRKGHGHERRHRKATAAGLAELGATVVAGMRDSQISKAALAETKAKIGKSGTIIHIPEDPSSQRSIRVPANEISGRFDLVNLLLNEVAVLQFDRARSQPTSLY
jgi:NAD(P)-dependent dehydrogenase (short-subunit alcohol dehydrogenase family)